MKKVFLSLMLVLATVIFAQQEWELIFHSTYIPTLEKEMGEMMDAGYEPVGIEFVRDGVKKGLLTMYEKTEEPSIQGMKIIEIFDVNTLKETLTKEAQGGYLPLDLTFVEKSIILLFAKYEDSPISQWSLDVAEASYEAIGKSLEKHINNSREWIPVGIMGLESLEKYVLMYLKVPGYEIQDYNVYTFDGLENFQAGIDGLYAEGWSICGFSIYGDEWDVVVVDVAENSMDAGQSILDWQGNWGDGSLVINNVTNTGFNFIFEVVSSRGHIGNIDDGIAYFNPDGLAVFYDDNYPDYSILFSLHNNQITVNEVNPMTKTQNLNSPFSGAGVSFTGTYSK